MLTGLGRKSRKYKFNYIIIEVSNGDTIWG